MQVKMNLFLNLIKVRDDSIDDKGKFNDVRKSFLL